MNYDLHRIFIGLTGGLEAYSFASDSNTGPSLTLMKYLPLILGLLCGIGALYQLYRGSRLFLKGQSVEGRVVANERSFGKSGVYYPIVEFKTLSGQTYRCKGQSGTLPAEYEVNDPVTVHFDPDKPTDTFIGTFFSLIQGALFSIGLGVLFSWFGLKILGFGKPRASTGSN